MLLGKLQCTRIFCTVIGLLLFIVNVQAQRVKVPSTIHFADMRLDLSPAAQKKIQTDVDALLRSEKYFQLKLDKVDAHFPLIEQVLKEEKVPDDIKYLVIQESALVGDAVSTSNAIGYWQFKEPAAREVGLTINHAVDERMNIITATRGAAQYFKNNNGYFNNWLYALMAYMTGPGGALKIADKSQYNRKHMRLGGDTHWYVLKFLAHKVAFEKFIGKNPNPKVQLFTYTKGNGKTLAEIAEEFNLQEEDLEPYNRWLKVRRVPDDKQYYVIIPDFSGDMNEELLVQAEETETVEERKESTQASAEVAGKHTEVADTRKFPVIESFKRRGAEVKINGIPGIIAREGDNIRSISQRAGVSPSKIVTYNDFTSKQSEIIPGKAYYIRKKRNRGAAHYHVVEPGETLWSISQRFSLKLKKLIRNNRMREEEAVKPGRVLWMRFIRPRSFPIEYRDAPNKNKAIPPVNTASSQTVVKNEAKPVEIPTKPEPISIPEEKSAEANRTEPEPDIQTVNPESYNSWETASGAEISAATPLSKHEAPAPSADESTGNAVDHSFEANDVVFTDTHDTAEDLPEAYVVQKGDTYYSIAQKYQLTVADIRKYNNLSDSDPLRAGQELRLQAPAPRTEQAAAQEEEKEVTYVFHQVKPGETLYGIAREYDVTIKDLMNWNGKDTFDVSLGEQLKVARK